MIGTWNRTLMYGSQGFFVKKEAAFFTSWFSLVVSNDCDSTPKAQRATTSMLYLPIKSLTSISDFPDPGTAWFKALTSWWTECFIKTDIAFILPVVKMGVKVYLTCFHLKYFHRLHRDMIDLLAKLLTSRPEDSATCFPKFCHCWHWSSNDIHLPHLDPCLQSCQSPWPWSVWVDLDHQPRPL